MENFISDDEARRRHEALRNLARHLVASAEDAEDAVQDTWLARLNQASEPIHNNEGWLRRVLRRKVGLQHRQRSSRAEHERRAARPEAQLPEEGVLQHHLAATLHAALDDLREPYQTVLRLRYIEQVSERGICEALDRPLTTVKSQISRGLALLRRGLDGRFDEDRGSWTGAFLGFFLGVRSALRGTAPALATVAGGLAALQIALVVAVGTSGDLVASRPARPVLSSPSAPELGALPPASEQLASVSLPETTETAVRGGERWSEPKPPPLVGPAPASRSAASGKQGARPAEVRAAREAARRRAQRPPRKSPKQRRDGRRALFFGVGHGVQEGAGAPAEEQVRKVKHKRRSGGRLKKAPPPKPTGTPPVSGKGSKGKFGSSGAPPDLDPPVAPKPSIQKQARPDSLRVLPLSSRASAPALKAYRAHRAARRRS